MLKQKKEKKLFKKDTEVTQKRTAQCYFLCVHNSQKSDGVKEDMECVKWPTDWPRRLRATRNPPRWDHTE